MCGSGPSEPAAPAVEVPARPPSLRQLRLFPAPSPLVDRLGVAFFRRIPRSPGVYFFHDAGHRILYVGKAVDLRQRLNSYRYPARAARKVVRLIHAARRISWELCASEAEALLRENHLLRTLRPPFNRLGTWTQTPSFVWCSTSPQTLQLLLASHTPDTAPAVSHLHPTRALPDTAWPIAPPASGIVSTECYGAFKAGGAFSFTALARSLWLALRAGTDYDALPRPLLPGRTVRTARFDHGPVEDWVRDLRAFLAGHSPSLWARLEAQLPAGRCPFHQQVRAGDLETLADFYARGPERNRRLRLHLGRDEAPVSRAELDDWLVLAGSADADVPSPPSLDPAPDTTHGSSPLPSR